MLPVSYAQYYAHNHCNYATVYIQFYYFNDYISIVRLQPVAGVIHYAMLQCSYIWPIMLNIMSMRKLVPHFVPNCGWLLHHKWRLLYTYNYIDYTDYFVVTFIHKLNPAYYAGIMLNAFNNLLCSKLCWHKRPGPTYK